MTKIELPIRLGSNLRLFLVLSAFFAISCNRQKIVVTDPNEKTKPFCGTWICQVKGSEGVDHVDLKLYLGTVQTEDQGQPRSFLRGAIFERSVFTNDSLGTVGKIVGDSNWHLQQNGEFSIDANTATMKFGLVTTTVEVDSTDPNSIRLSQMGGIAADLALKNLLLHRGSD